MNLNRRIRTSLIQNSNFIYLSGILSSHPYYIAGGYIRNIILERSVKDIDLFIKFPKEDIYRKLENEVEHGELVYGPLGSLRWYPPSSKIYFDIIPFSNFFLNKKDYCTISELLQDFDITINAIGYDPKSDKIIDPLSGVSDIQRKIIRATHFNFPDILITDDNYKLSSLSIFWFRIIHYKSALNFNFEQSTLNWVIKNRFRSKDLPIFQKMFFKPIIADEISYLFDDKNN